MKLVTVISLMLVSSAFGQITNIGVFPQVVTGNGWSTTLLFSNTHPTITGTLIVQFFDTAGRPMLVQVLEPINVFGQQKLSSQISTTVTVGPKHSYSFETLPYSAGIQQGYALLVSTNPVNIINVKSVVTYRNGALTSESITTLLPLTMNNYGISFDNTNGFSTGVAWVNLDTQH